MNPQDIKPAIEAMLMASDQPLTVERLGRLFEEDGSTAPSREALLEVLAQLQNDYADRGVELVEVASGYRFQARAEYAERVGRLWEERKPRYSRALLETLALIAYRQPITRGEIEHIRGVAVSTNIMRLLLEREWVRVVGHRDVPGRPSVYATTKEFLDYFGLKSLEELPPLAELTDIDHLSADLFAAAARDQQDARDGEVTGAADAAEPEATAPANASDATAAQATENEATENEATENEATENEAADDDAPSAPGAAAAP